MKDEPPRGRSAYGVTHEMVEGQFSLAEPDEHLVVTVWRRKSPLTTEDAQRLYRFLQEHLGGVPGTVQASVPVAGARDGWRRWKEVEP